MDDEPAAEEYQQRYAMENLLLEVKSGIEEMKATRAEVKTAKAFSRNWAVISMSVVVAMACFFLFVLFASGVGAIRENTRTVRELRSSSITNKSVLDSILQDRESVRLNFEILKRQLGSIETRINDHGAPPPAKGKR